MEWLNVGVASAPRAVELNPISVGLWDLWGPFWWLVFNLKFCILSSFLNSRGKVKTLEDTKVRRSSCCGGSWAFRGGAAALDAGSAPWGWSAELTDPRLFLQLTVVRTCSEICQTWCRWGCRLALNLRLLVQVRSTTSAEPEPYPGAPFLACCIGQKCFVLLCVNHSRGQTFPQKAQPVLVLSSRVRKYCTE